MQKKVGGWSGGKLWSEERRCQKGPERGAIFTSGRAPGGKFGIDWPEGYYYQPEGQLIKNCPTPNTIPC